VVELIPILEEDLFIIIIVVDKDKLLFTVGIVQHFAFVMERWYRFGRKYLLKIIIAVGSIVESVHPYSEEVQLVLRKFLVCVDEQYTARAYFCV
jgi:hypothetical protein